MNLYPETVDEILDALIPKDLTVPPPFLCRYWMRGSPEAIAHLKDRLPEGIYELLMLCEINVLPMGGDFPTKVILDSIMVPPLLHPEHIQFVLDVGASEEAWRSRINTTVEWRRTGKPYDSDGWVR